MSFIWSLEQIYECINKENPAVTIISDDFNARGVLSKFLISNNLEELINEPTHIREDGSQSCIDLICADQPYIFTETGVLLSIDSHSKHNIIPYKRKVWYYKTATTVLIRNGLLNINWQSLFLGLKAIEMSLVFTDTILLQAYF